MVNRGRPSKDCLPCRVRKLRCDLIPSGCGQCRRARLRCHGYRNPQDLIFRDETRATGQKVALQQPWMQAANEPTSVDLGLNVRAQYLFFSLYVSGFSPSLEAIVPLYRQASSLDHLPASIEAVSLAFLASQLHDTTVARSSHLSYLVAIRRVRDSLALLPTSNVESLLLSIILLDMYEKVTNGSPQASTSWMSHVEGGSSLLVSHADQIVSTPTGRQLVARLITAVTVSCGAAVVPVPDSIVQLRGLLDPFVSDAKWRFTGILRHVVDLQADVRANAGGDLAKRAEHLDGLLVALHMGLPPSWKQRQISPVELDPLILGSHYDEYADHFVTQVTNGIRAMRLVLNNIILKHAPQFDSSVSDRIQDVTRQICASAPQFILPAREGHSVPFTPLQSLQCRTLLAPLYIAYQESTQHVVRDWILRCLRYMSETGGVKAAKGVAEAIKNEPDLDYWSVYASIGCYALAA